MGHMISFIKYLSIFFTLNYERFKNDNELYVSAFVEYERKNYQESISLFLKATEKTENIMFICHMKILLYYIYQDIKEFENADEMKQFVLSSDTDELLLNEIKIAEAKHIQLYNIPKDINIGYPFDENTKMVFLFYVWRHHYDSEFYKTASHILEQYGKIKFINLNVIFGYESVYPLE